jgi:hypothetical protein|tara:strand:- start:251 stop:1075 length:825 start_codon:yes stop_codon:yes gene_type:complete
MSVIADKISSDSRSFLAGVKSSTAKNDRTLNSAVNLGMRLDQKEIELSQKRRKINAESFEAPQQIEDNFNEGYISGYQFGTADGIAKGVELGKNSILNPLDELFKALPIAAVAILAGIPQLTGLLDLFLPDRDKSVDPDVDDDGGVSPTSAADQSGGLGTPDLPYRANEDGEVVHIPDPNKRADENVDSAGNPLPLETEVGGDDMQQLQPVSNNYNPENMGGADSNTKLVVMRQPIIVTKKEMGTVVNNGSQLAVIVSGDQRRSDFINFAQRIT